MKIVKFDVPYAQVPNVLIFDKRLSWRAKAVFAYIQAKPNDWNFSSERMTEDANDGVDSTREGIKELEKFGYLSRHRQGDGRIEYDLKLPQEPPREIPSEGKSQRGKIPRIYKKDYIQRKSNTNILSESGLSREENKSIDQILDRFRLLNADYKKFFANKTYRKTVAELIETYGQEKIIKAIYLAKFAFSDKFFPHFLTPVELQKKWGKVKKFNETSKVENKRYQTDFEEFIEKMEKEVGGEVDMANLINIESKRVTELTK